MPIDARIPLGVQVPQGLDPLESYGRVVSLQSALQQQRAGQMQLKNLAQQGKMQDLQLQQAEQDMLEQKLLREAYGQVGGDLDKLRTAVAGRVKPQTLIKLDEAILERKHKLATIADKDLGNLAQKYKTVAGIGQGLLLRKPDERAAIWPTVRASLISDGIAKAEALPEQVPDDAWFETRITMAQSAADVMSAEYQRREDARKAELQGPNLETARANAKVATATAAGQAPIQPAQQQQIVQAQAAAAEIKRHNQEIEKGAAARRAETERYHRTMEGGAMPNLPTGTPGQINDAVLEQLTPGDRAIVKKIAAYEYPIPTSGRALTSPYWQRMLQAVAAYDPTFDAAQYSVRMQLRKDFTSGKSGQNVTRLNTVLGHLDSLKAAADKLGNIGLTKANTLKNWMLSNVGDPRVKNFEMSANAVESELANVFKGTGATDQEIKAWRQNLSSSASGEQLRGAIDSAIELLSSRMMALQDQYEKGLGRPKDFHFLNDKSRKILTKLGKNPDTMDPIGSPAAGTTPAAAAAPGAPQATHRFNPQTGRIEPIGR